ncbi:MAG: rhomboid family intramembrane serine protease [Acidimicrobiales bacterium]
MACARSSSGPPRTRRLPAGWSAAKVLVGVHVVVFLVGLVSRGSVDVWQGTIGRFEYDYGLNVAFLVRGEWYRLLTSGFVHFGILHLAMNMFALWQLGRELEAPLGPTRFTLLYVSSILGGAGLVVALQVVDIPFLSQPGLQGGASGGIFGLLGALAIGLRQRGIPIMQTTLGPVLVINLLLTLSLQLSIGGHLGGLLAGAAAGSVLLRPRNGPAPARDLWAPIGVGFAAVVLAVVATALA